MRYMGNTDSDFWFVIYLRPCLFTIIWYFPNWNLVNPDAFLSLTNGKLKIAEGLIFVQTDKNFGFKMGCFSLIQSCNGYIYIENTTVVMHVPYCCGSVLAFVLMSDEDFAYLI